MGLGMALHVCDLSTWDVVEGELGTQGHPQLPSGFKATTFPLLTQDHVSKQGKKTKKQNQPNQKRKKETKQIWISTYFFLIGSLLVLTF